MFRRERRIFDRFRDYTEAAAVGESLGFDAILFRALFEFLYLQIAFVRRNNVGHYKFTDDVLPFYNMEFRVDKFLRAYEPAVAYLNAALTGATLGRGLVNRQIEAEAYGEIGSPPNPLVPHEVKQRGLRSLVDFGCGPGTLLARRASEDPAFVGWGLDLDSEMLRVAAELSNGTGLGMRLQLVEADAMDFARVLPQAAIDRAEALHCKGLFNEFFRDGDAKAVGFLQQLRHVFPQRILFVVDYFGRLLRVRERSDARQHKILHDLLQHLTAQGTPPADLGHWVEIYAKTDCEVLHAYEGDNNGISWFVHVVQL